MARARWGRRWAIRPETPAGSEEKDITYNEADKLRDRAYKLFFDKNYTGVLEALDRAEAAARLIDVEVEPV